jgi:CSLREA domain-containing protein
MHSLNVRRAAVIALIAIACRGSVSHANAATFTVNSTADDASGTCGTAIGGCTLRAAILAAVATPGRDTIRFDPTVFPLGSPAEINVVVPLPAIADPAGTIVDGTGAGVLIGQQLTGGGMERIDGLVFASAPGVPLAGVAVLQVSVVGFPGAGILICGGVPPDCEDDVTGPVVQGVVASGNEQSGVEIHGRNVGKAQVTDAVATHNGNDGILVDASQSVAGTRVERCAANENARTGIAIGELADTVSDTAIRDSIATHDTNGIAVAALSGVAKTKITNVAGINNSTRGIAIESLGALSATSIANSVGSGNETAAGIEIAGNVVSGATLQDVAANENRTGIVLDGQTAVTGAKITSAAAVGNQFDGIALREHVTGAKITRASVVGNNVGLRVIGSGATLKQVRASENAEDGIRLDGPGGGNRVEKCAGTANQGPGIAIRSGSTGNTVQGNVALGNDAVDVLDDNPDCDADVWKKNVFETRSAPCIH